MLNKNRDDKAEFVFIFVYFMYLLHLSKPFNGNGTKKRKGTVIEISVRWSKLKLLGGRAKEKMWKVNVNIKPFDIYKFFQYPLFFLL